MPISVGVYGATGYTGLELVRLLCQHPEAEVCFVTSESSAGSTLRDVWPLAPALPLISAKNAPLDTVQAVFLCLPNTQSAPIVCGALQCGAKVVDLSADLRLNDPAVYAQWYKSPHPAPDLLPAPYGLPEIGTRNQIARATHVANPGCYATAMLLALVPLAEGGLLDADAPIIVDAKSGVSGAGRTPKTHILFGEVHGNFSPYNIGRAHRHLPEVEQALAAHGVTPGRLIFSPHLLPTDRGILATVYVQISEVSQVRGVFEQAYRDEPLIEILPDGELATLAHVVRTPRAVLSVTPASDQLVIVVAAIDNLLKGAASQAVQNFNLMWDFPETTGLTG